MLSALQTTEVPAASSSFEGSVPIDNGTLPNTLIKALRDHNVLDPEQERRLIAFHHIAQEKLDAICKQKMEIEDAESWARKQEIKQLQDEIHEKETILLKHNWRLILSIARKFFRRLKALKNLSERQLLFAGAKGFIYALRNFKIEFGARLITYADPCIEGSIKNLIKQERKIVLNVRNLRDKDLFSTAKGKFCREHNTATIDYSLFAKELNIELENLQRFAQELGLNKFSSLSSTSTGSKTKFSDLLAAVEAEDSEIEIPALKAAIKELNPQQRVVLALRFGIKYLASLEDIEIQKQKSPNLGTADFSVNHSGPEIAKVIGVSKARIQKIEEESLDKLFANLETYRSKFHWIPDAVNIQGLKQMLWHLFDHKQKFCTSFDEFSSLLLYRLASEKFNYRYNTKAVLKPNEEKILRYRLGLIKNCKGGLGDVAMLLAGKRSPDKLVSEIRRIEADAIRKIYAFFNGKNPNDLKEFFYPVQVEKPKQVYSRELVVNALQSYLHFPP